MHGLILRVRGNFRTLPVCHVQLTLPCYPCLYPHTSLATLALLCLPKPITCEMDTSEYFLRPVLRVGSETTELSDCGLSPQSCSKIKEGGAEMSLAKYEVQSFFLMRSLGKLLRLCFLTHSLPPGSVS